MSNLALLFTLARLDAESARRPDGRAFTLAQNVTRDQLIARVAQDGVDRKTARRFADDAAGSAISKTSGNGDLAVKGDVLTYDDVHPWRAQYSVVAVAVRTPTLER
jgi:hypothetical protein